jgi:ribosomal protein S17E
MTEKTTLRLPDNLKKALFEDRTQKGLSENEYMTRALEHFLKCEKPEESQTMKMIVTRYAGHCIKCSNEIPSGSWALYGKGVGLICLDCYIQRIGDKSLVAKYLKNRELTQITRALQNEADKLAEKVEVYQAGDKLAQLTEQQEKLNKLVEEYLTTKIGTEQEKEALEEIIRESEKTKQLIRDIEGFVKRYIETRKSQRKRKQEQEAYAA